jgi:hypothetical protein
VRRVHVVRLQINPLTDRVPALSHSHTRCRLRRKARVGSAHSCRRPARHPHTNKRRIHTRCGRWCSKKRVAHSHSSRSRCRCLDRDRLVHGGARRAFIGRIQPTQALLTRPRHTIADFPTHTHTHARALTHTLTYALTRHHRRYLNYHHHLSPPPQQSSLTPSPLSLFASCVCVSGRAASAAPTSTYLTASWTAPSYR